MSTYLRRTTLAVLSLLLLTSCGFYMAPVMPPSGLLFGSVKAPIDTNADNTTIGSKTGEAASISILGLFAFGDCSINSAARDGNMSTVTHADYNYTNVLWIYQSFTTIVYGD